MKRTPIVATATAAGAVAVLAFHTSPVKLSAGSLAPATAGAKASGSTSGPSPRSGQRSSSPASSAPTGGTKTVNGPSVNYYYGVLAVSVTVDGKRVTKVAIASLNDGGMTQSQMIDQQAIPILEQEAMQAQSGNIQGVSGASYTSAGFRQSLQAALRSAGI